MASYKYRGISKSGEVVNGVVEAPDKFEAVAKIKPTCPIVETIEEVDVKQRGIAGKQKKIDAKNLSLLCSRFAIILGVGLPIVQAVDMLSGQMEDKHVSKMLKDISKEVAMGRSLSSCFAARKEIFPITFIETVRSGEESGDLAKAFDRLGTYYEKNSKTKQKVVSALTYPAFVMVVGIVVMVIIMTVAVPSFSSSFASLGTELPTITKVVIGMSNFFTKYGMLLLLVIAALCFAATLYARTEKGAEFFAAMILGIPLIGKIVQLSASSQFAHTMSMMISAGMPILKCIETSGKAVGNYILRRDILNTASGVEEGRSLGSCLEKSQYLPAMLVDMVAMGESTGTMETTLSSVGSFYDNEVDVSTTKALSILEPAIICVLAVFVILILFSVYLPMFSMYGSI